MTISDDILNNDYPKVVAHLKRGININFIDEYGYTPLIQACIKNNTQIARLLLRHGAFVDSVDIAGHAAIHWAVDNNNVELARMLLEHKANPNNYTSDGRSPLFLPLLRNHHELQKLLLKYGADIHFPKDYINTKLIGHRFELTGMTDIVNTDGVFIPVDMEGFFLEFTVSIIRDSLDKFVNSFVANRLNLPLNQLSTISKSMINAYELRKYKHYNVNVEDHLDDIKQRLKPELLMLPVSYAGHAITFEKYGPLFAKCDRGVNKMSDPIVIHRIGNPSALNFEFYKDLLYTSQTTKAMKEDIYTHLGLKPVIKLPIRHQITGNCSWANVEASIPTMLFMLLFQKIKNPDKAQVKNIVKEVMKFYVVWKEWDKDRALEDCLRDFDQMNPNRRKAKAALLGAVFFQACDYRKKKDVDRAEKMMKILKKPDYHYVLRSYINVFIKSGKGGPKAKAFHRLFDALGVRLSTFDY